MKVGVARYNSPWKVQFEVFYFFIGLRLTTKIYTNDTKAII